MTTPAPTTLVAAPPTTPPRAIPRLATPPTAPRLTTLRTVFPRTYRRCSMTHTGGHPTARSQTTTLTPPRILTPATRLHSLHTPDLLRMDTLKRINPTVAPPPPRIPPRAAPTPSIPGTTAARTDHRMLPIPQ